MNILEVVFSHTWGGLEMQACRMSEKLGNREYNVLVAAPEGTNIISTCKQAGLKTVCMKPILKYLDVITAIKISRLIKKNKIDIIHCHSSKDLSTLVLAKKFAGSGKIVLTQHMDSRFDKMDFFHKWVYKNVDNIVAVTRSMSQNIFDFTPATINQIKYVYNGIDINFYQPSGIKTIHNEYDIPETALIVGMIARLDRLKKQELLVEAAVEVLKEFPDTYFMIVGEETPGVGGEGYLKILNYKIKQRGLEKNFRITGFVDDVRPLIDSLDVSVLTSPNETFGLVLIESLAMKVPVIGSDNGGVPEIIEDGVNGFLIEPDNSAELADKLIKLLGDKDLRTKMGKKGQKIVNEKFDIDKKITEYERLFADLMIKDIG
ncbi:MAG: glycosyltransferase family 4 protein [bacterium]|nr:glycosyltransferase family 4 protein [bacterium]